MPAGSRRSRMASHVNVEPDFFFIKMLSVIRNLTGCFCKVSYIYSFLYIDIIKNNFMFWVFVKKNLTSYTAKTVWNALLVVSVSQVNITFSTLSCYCINGLKLHSHSSFPLYSSVPYVLIHRISCFEIYRYIRNETGCFEKKGFL